MLKKLFTLIILTAVIAIIIAAAPGNSPDSGMEKSDTGKTVNITVAARQHLPVRTDRCSYELYLPSGYTKSNSYPLFVTLSPGGNGADFEKAAGYACETLGFIMVGSNDFRNGVSSDIVLPKVDAMIADVCNKYNVDKSNIFIGGFSGGGMGSYFMAMRRPGFFKGLVINNGRIHPDYLKVDPLKKMRVKRVALMSSDADGTVKRELLEEQAELLKKAGITVNFLKWKGGHEIAPSSLYETALKWVYRGY